MTEPMKRYQPVNSSDAGRKRRDMREKLGKKDHRKSIKNLELSILGTGVFKPKGSLTEKAELHWLNFTEQM